VRLALVGATGAVGETMLRVLEERAVPISEFGAFASRDHDEPLRFRGRDLRVRATTPVALEGFDVVVFASGEDASVDFAEGCVRGGAIVIDNSPAFRMRDDVPLVVPEINAHAIRAEHRIFPVANCTAIVLVMGLAPILRVAGLRSVRAATYQAVSGAGRAGLDELAAAERAAIDGADEPPPRAFAARIARNVIPQVGGFAESGDTGEERKVVAETRKILERPHLHVAATSVRVPVRTAHSAAVFVETERDTDVAELARAFAEATGVAFHPRGIVTPRDVEGSDLVHVARLRSESGSRRAFQFWVVGDQLRKGAATNAVQILELLAARNLLPDDRIPVARA
jgi:aspartate-semialdehyde dehydrogenase